jgi:Sortase domain
MAPSTSSTGLLARSAASPRLRPFLTALAALSLITGGAGQAIALSPTTVTAAPANAPQAATNAFSTDPAPASLTAPVRVTVAPRPATADAAAATRKASTGKRAPAATTTTRTVASRPAATVYRGTNHVWIPSLGVSRSVAWFPCSRTTDPANYVYRWGCAGANNVYLLGHAWGVFKPLHDAYYNGRLRKGMKVVYADSSSRVHTYSVIWWKVVAPTTAASWAWAAQSRPSMTLQTCIGSGGNYRLMVRLVQVA